MYSPPEYSNNYNPIIKPLNGLEYLVIFLAILSLIILILVGFFNQEGVNHDRQRQFDITQQLIPALIDFYKNSSTVENKRFYPIAVCSGNLNEVDYELTLRQHLSGQLTQIDSHSYIRNEIFPRDRQGSYSQTFNQRRIKFRCPEKLSNFVSIQNNPNQKIYNDFESCNFSRSQKYLKCYLYTSSNSGDSFEIGYFSQSKNCFTVYKKFRSQDLKSELQCRF